jgi:hypothetical protein
LGVSLQPPESRSWCWSGTFGGTSVALHHCMRLQLGNVRTLRR